MSLPGCSHVYALLHMITTKVSFDRSKVGLNALRFYFINIPGLRKSTKSETKYHEMVFLLCQQDRLLFPLLSSELLRHHNKSIFRIQLQKSVLFKWNHNLSVYCISSIDECVHCKAKGTIFIAKMTTIGYVI